MIDVTTSDHHGHWDVEDIRRLCEYRDQLRGNLSLAEEGLANYAQEVERLSTLLAMVAVHFEHPELGGLSEEQQLAISEWYETFRERVGVSQPAPHAAEQDAKV